MTAPVAGSGYCPAWMLRVAKPRRLLLFMSPSSRRSSHAAAQMVQQVDAGNQPQKLAILHYQRDMVLGEDRQQIGQRPARLDHLEPGVHGAGDRLAEALRPAIDRQKQIGLVDDADDLGAF